MRGVDGIVKLIGGSSHITPSQERVAKQSLHVRIEAITQRRSELEDGREATVVEAADVSGLSQQTTIDTCSIATRRTSNCSPVNGDLLTGSTERDLAQHIDEESVIRLQPRDETKFCLLYTSDAADE